MLVYEEKNFFSEYEEECPMCGEPATHKENEKYSVRCYTCNFAQSWESYERYEAWLLTREERLATIEKKKNKKIRGDFDEFD